MRVRASWIAQVVDGRLEGTDVEVDGATQDSRLAKPGSLFVPIVAARDGHDFVADAVGAGAVAYLTSRPPVGAGAAAIVVDDTAVALRRLATAVRELLPDRVIGITGSVGKTSTKDLAAAALATTFATHASDRSFNNEIGVPLTLLEAPEGTEAVVVEKGARGVGHIADLCAIARPTIGVVTTVGAAHLELFGSIDEVVVAKGELIEALPTSGTAVLNAGDAAVLSMRSRTSARVLTFGADGDVRAACVEFDDELRPRFVIESEWGSAPVTLAVRGAHNVANALAAAAAALAAGSTIESIAEGLATAGLSPWRMDLLRAPSGARILNDAYNANPVSMRAALHELARLRDAQRRIAVLGRMAELGEHTAVEHRAIGDLARELGIEVIAVDAPEYGTRNVAGIDEALAAIEPLGETDVVLVKGSRVAGLERLAANLVRRTG
jgi:UDP-N-acetylmuramoyl-tripeptide--D-alanyl-D-alanine ligase